MSAVDLPPDYTITQQRLRNVNVAVEALLTEAPRHTGTMPESLAQRIQLVSQAWDAIRGEIGEQRQTAPPAAAVATGAGKR